MENIVGTITLNNGTVIDAEYIEKTHDGSIVCFQAKPRKVLNIPANKWSTITYR